MASKAKKALYEAEENYDKARTFDEQSKNISTELTAVAKRSTQIEEILNNLNSYFAMSNDAMLDVVFEAGTNWNNFNRKQKETVGACAQLAKTIKNILDTPLLGEDGKLTYASQEAVSIGKEALYKLE